MLVGVGKTETREERSINRKKFRIENIRRLT